MPAYHGCSWTKWSKWKDYAHWVSWSVMPVLTQRESQTFCRWPCSCAISWTCLNEEWRQCNKLIINYSLIFTIFFQLLSPMCASNTSVQWARVMVQEILPTWFKVDHNVSKISPLDCPALMMKLGENLAKQISWCPWTWNKPMPGMITSSGWTWRNRDSLTLWQKFIKYWQLTS